MTLFKDFQDYIADLAGMHKLVAHGSNGRKSFFRMNNNMEELSAIPNNAASPFVAVTGFGARPVGDIDYPRLEQDATLFFGSHAKNNADNIERAQQEAYLVMMDFFTRFREDSEEGICGILQLLQIDRISMEMIGPVGEFEYGWMMTLPFKTDMPDYNPDNWNG